MEVEKIVAGALFDFCGYLTTREKAIEVGASHEASSIIDALEKWANERTLNLEGAAVIGWERMLWGETARTEDGGSLK